jgi:hypothetical protein
MKGFRPDSTGLGEGAVVYSCEHMNIQVLKIVRISCPAQEILACEE